YYWSDLKGLTELGLDDDEQEVNLGQIHELLETGANDVMVVRATPDSIDSEERMIPCHKDVVQRVDLEAGRKYVNWGVDY
ncbi:ribosome maturation factor RimM, partial [Acinetobacter baumannii]